MAQATSPPSSGKNVINLKDWVKRFGDSARKYNYEPKPRRDFREADTEYCLTRVELAITEAKKKRHEDDHQ